MTTATEKHTERCPDCGRAVTGKSAAGAKNKLTSHQKRLHSASEPAPETPTEPDTLSSVVPGIPDYVTDNLEPASAPGPIVIESGFGPIEGGEDSVPEPEGPTPTVDAKVLLDGLYAHDKRGVLAWIHSKYPKPQNLMRDMNSVGLG